MGGGAGGSLPNSNQSVGGVLSCQGTGSGNGGYLRCNAVAVAGADGNLTGFSDVILKAAVQCPAGQLAVGRTSESPFLHWLCLTGHELQQVLACFLSVPPAVRFHGHGHNRADSRVSVRSNGKHNAAGRSGAGGDQRYCRVLP